MGIQRGVQQRRFGPDDVLFFSDLQALVVLSLDTLKRRVSLSPGLILLSDSSRVRGT